MNEFERISGETNIPLTQEIAAVRVSDVKPVRRISPVLFGFIVLAIVFLLYQVVGGTISYILFGASITDDNVNLMRWISICGQFLFMLIPSILLTRSQGWDVKKHFRLNKPSWKEVVLVLIAVAALQIALQVYLIGQDYVLEHFLTPASLKPYIDQIKKMINDLYTKLVFARSPLELVFIVLVIGLTPALCEESLFRGVVQGSFEKGLKAGWSIVLCGMIFAGFHLNPFAFIPLSVLGIYFSFIVWRGNSIILAMIAHLFNNSLAAVSLYFLGTDAVIIPSQSSADLSSSVLTANFVVGISVFVLATFFFWKVSSYHKTESVQ